MIEIKITADTALEALKDLTELTAKLTAATAQAAPMGAIGPGKAAKTTTKQPTPPAQEQTPTEDAPADDKTPPPEEQPDAPAEKSTSTYTAETVRAAVVKAAGEHGKPKVKAILTAMGVAGVTELTPEQYPEFMRKLGELNA